MLLSVGGYMLQISLNIPQLSQSQREFIADFILNFPDGTAIIPDFTTGDAEVNPDEVFAPQADHLDKNGYPWDERIHASSRAKTADGSWRSKRGVDPALITQVEAELRALMAIPVAPVVSVPTATMPVPIPAASVPPPPAPAANDKQVFISFITFAGKAIEAKKLTQEELKAAVEAAGVPSLPLLGNRLDLVPQVQASIEALLLTR
jgi:hypothetical protein